MTRIVLISGKQGSGKTTLANYLETRVHLSWTIHKLTFASVIYDIHNAARDIMKSYGIEVGNEKDGDLLQFLGTNWGRKKFGDNVWVNVAKEKVKRISEFYADSKNLIIISDCRFENEFDAFPEALRIRLRCNEDIRKTRAEMWRENTYHLSETNLDSYAFNGRFDLEIDTALSDETIVATLVAAQIDKDCWMEKR